jgi:hypothetical protein
MGPVRRAINFVISLALAIGGIGGLAYHLLFSERALAGRWGAFPLLVFAVIGFIGLYWFWADFIKGESRSKQ